MNDSTVDEMRLLIEALREGTLGAEDHARLELWLRTSPEGRRYYVRYLMLCTELRTLVRRGALSLRRREMLSSRCFRPWARNRCRQCRACSACRGYGRWVWPWDCCVAMLAVWGSLRGRNAAAPRSPVRRGNAGRDARCPVGGPRQTAGAPRIVARGAAAIEARAG